MQLRIVVVCTFKDVLAKRSISRRWVADVPSPGALPQSRLPHPSPEAPTALPDTVSPPLYKAAHLSVPRIGSGFIDMIRLQAVEQTLDDCEESIEQSMQPNLPFTFVIYYSV